MSVFDNQTGDAELDSLGKMTVAWITEGISQIDALEAVPAMTALSSYEVLDPGSDAGAGGTRLRALAEATGADTVVSGAYFLVGDTLQFQAQITDATGGDLLHVPEPVGGPRAAVDQVIEELRQRVMGSLATLGDTEAGAGGCRPSRTTTPTGSTSAGVEAYGDDSPRAITHFERAGPARPGLRRAPRPGSRWPIGSPGAPPIRRPPSAGRMRRGRGCLVRSATCWIG